MGVISLDIEMANAPQYYRPRDLIEGYLIITCDDDGEDLASVSMRVRGTVGTHEKLETNVTFPSDMIKYVAEEIVFDKEVSLGMNGISTYTLQPGVTRCSFSVEIPPTPLPSSMVGRYGRVYYKMCAVANHNDGTNDTAENEFYFCPDILVEHELECNSPEPLVKQKNLSSCCCIGNGTVGFSVQILKEGFLPGDDIVCTTSAFNLAKDKKERTLNIILSSVGTYLVKGKNVYDRNDHTKYSSSLDFQESRENANIPISIPVEITPSLMKCCKLIEILYKIDVNITIRATGKCEVSGTIPIIIGTHKSALTADDWKV